MAKPKTKNTKVLMSAKERLEPTQSKILLLGSSAANSGGMGGQGFREWMGLYLTELYARGTVV